METSEIIKNWVIVFIIWFVIILIVGWVKSTIGIVNNGNIWTSGKCYRNCK